MPLDRVHGHDVTVWQTGFTDRALGGSPIQAAFRAADVVRHGFELYPSCAT
jgi:hypothetical protein